jgi:Reverse transcriptase (RNA-dependent DNA polymerase)
LPLYEVAKKGLANNTLPDFFMSADIKLIPKKGDLSNIKNWRPISLLSNLYKIVSRAINARLKAIAPRILSRAQKGFCPNKYMHEVIINSTERIKYCNENNIAGVVISADLSKAFDSVSHDFMIKCYDFYRFGPRIKTWLKSIGTGRNARILLGGGGEATENFDLCKGHAQGDSPSPLLFNFAQQIMLFKLELDPEIKRMTITLSHCRIKSQ